MYQKDCYEIINGRKRIIYKKTKSNVKYIKYKGNMVKLSDFKRYNKKTGAGLWSLNKAVQNDNIYIKYNDLLINNLTYDVKKWGDNYVNIESLFNQIKDTITNIIEYLNVDSEILSERKNLTIILNKLETLHINQLSAIDIDKYNEILFKKDRIHIYNSKSVTIYKDTDEIEIRD